MLTMFLEMKPHTSVGFDLEYIFELIVDYYKRLHNMGIVEQHGFNFVTFQLQGDVKQLWWSYVESLKE